MRPSPLSLSMPLLSQCQPCLPELLPSHPALQPHHICVAGGMRHAASAFTDQVSLPGPPLSLSSSRSLLGILYTFFMKSFLTPRARINSCPLCQTQSILQVPINSISFMMASLTSRLISLRNISATVCIFLWWYFSSSLYSNYICACLITATCQIQIP